jgi:DNA-binding MarR family transcriptional regulator
MSKHVKQLQYKVLQLIREQPGLYADDIAEELNVPVRIILKVINKLLKTGKINAKED